MAFEPFLSVCVPDRDGQIRVCPKEVSQRDLDLIKPRISREIVLWDFPVLESCLHDVANKDVELTAWEIVRVRGFGRKGRLCVDKDIDWTDCSNVLSAVDFFFAELQSRYLLVDYYRNLYPTLAHRKAESAPLGLPARYLKIDRRRVFKLSPVSQCCDLWKVQFRTTGLADLDGIFFGLTTAEIIVEIDPSWTAMLEQWAEQLPPPIHLLQK